VTGGGMKLLLADHSRAKAPRAAEWKLRVLFCDDGRWGLIAVFVFAYSFALPYS